QQRTQIVNKFVLKVTRLVAPNAGHATTAPREPALASATVSPTPAPGARGERGGERIGQAALGRVHIGARARCPLGCNAMNTTLAAPRTVLADAIPGARVRDALLICAGAALTILGAQV